MVYMRGPISYKKLNELNSNGLILFLLVVHFQVKAELR